MTEEARPFLDELWDAYALAQHRHPTTVNLIDPSGELTQLPGGTLQGYLVPPTQDGETDRTFALIDLSACLRTEALDEDIVTQFMFAFDDVTERSQAPPRLKSLNADLRTLRRDLVPWSSVLRHELRQWAEKCQDLRPLILVFRGVDELPEAWEDRVEGAVRWLSSCLGSQLTVILSERRFHRSDLRVWRSLPDRSAFQASIVEVIRARPVFAARLLRDDPLPTPHPAAPVAERPVGEVASFWRQLTARIWPGLVEPAVANRTVDGAAQDLGTDQSPDDIAELITAATYPSYPLRDQALLGLSAYVERVRRIVQRAGTKDSAETEIAVRSAAMRTIFLTLLEIVFPQLMHAARTEPDGYHRLYRLQLRFAGANPSTEMLLGLDGGRWREYGRDPLIRRFVAFAMGESPARGRRRVQPFASATAIKRHVQDLITNPSDSAERSWLEFLSALKAHVENRVTARVVARTTLRRDIWRIEGEVEQASTELMLAAEPFQAPSQASGSDHADAERIGWNARVIAAATRFSTCAHELKTLRDRLSERPPSFVDDELRRLLTRGLAAARPDDLRHREAGDRIEYALRRLAVLEMGGAPPVADGMDDQHVTSELRTCINELSELREQVDGNIGLDADSGIARAFALLGEYERAGAVLDGVARSVEDDALGRAAVDLGAAFVMERRGDRLDEAKKACLAVLRQAEGLGARELAARAAYGVLRCQIAQQEKAAAHAVLRAQAFLSIQTARVPSVTLTKPAQVFVSYRGRTQPFVRRIHDQIEKQAKERHQQVSVWVDYDAIDSEQTEYRPAMQLGLDLSDALLLVFSPGYFESHWCTYELSTSLARQRLDGQRFFWICVDDRRDVRGVDARAHVRKLAEQASVFDADSAFFRSQLELVLECKPLFDTVIPTSPEDSDEGSQVRRAAEWIANALIERLPSTARNGVGR